MTVMMVMMILMINSLLVCLKRSDQLNPQRWIPRPTAASFCRTLATKEKNPTKTAPKLLLLPFLRWRPFTVGATRWPQCEQIQRSKRVFERTRFLTLSVSQCVGLKMHVLFFLHLCIFCFGFSFGKNPRIAASLFCIYRIHTFTLTTQILNTYSHNPHYFHLFF